MVYIYIFFVTLVSSLKCNVNEKYVCCILADLIKCYDDDTIEKKSFHLQLDRD